jgi:hypothetical protein
MDIRTACIRNVPSSLDWEIPHAHPPPVHGIVRHHSRRHPRRSGRHRRSRVRRDRHDRIVGSDGKAWLTSSSYQTQPGTAVHGNTLSLSIEVVTDGGCTTAR